jgi:hypothetical protein
VHALKSSSSENAESVAHAGAVSWTLAFVAAQRHRVDAWGRRSGGFGENLDAVFDGLDALRELSERQRTRFVVIIHPDPIQVDLRLRELVLRNPVARREDYDFEFPQRRLQSYCADRAIDCLDLLPVLRSPAMPGRLYRPDDTRYSEAGQSLVAGAVALFLREGRLVPPVENAKAPVG